MNSGILIVFRIFPLWEYSIQILAHCFFLQVTLLGGILCVLAGILCLISASWSAAATLIIYNDPLITAALKREVGSSVYIGWASSLLLLLGGTLICCVCCEKYRPPPPRPVYMPYSNNTPFISGGSRPASLRSEAMRSYNSGGFDRHSPRKMVEHVAQVHRYNSYSSYDRASQGGVRMY